MPIPPPLINVSGQSQQGTFLTPPPNAIWQFRGQAFVFGGVVVFGGTPEPSPPPPSFTATGFEIEVGPY